MKKIFKGIRFSIYQRKQKRFSWREKTYEIVRRNVDGIQIIAIVNNKILVPHEQQPHRPKAKYGLFGGLMEKGETPLQWAKRELLEETGITFKDIKQRHINKKDGSVRRDEHRYIAKHPIKKDKQHLDAGEQIDLIPMTFNKRIAIVMSNQWRNKDFALHIAKTYIYPKKLPLLKKELWL